MTELAALGKQATLQEAVADLRRRGMSDAVQVTAYLSETYGEQWLLRQLVNVVAGLIASGGATGVTGKSAPVRLIGLPRVENAAGGFLESKRWVSADVGWKNVEDLSADDCRTIAAQYRLLSDVALRHSRWFADAAAKLDERGAATLGEIADSLSPLSALEPLDALARAGQGSDDVQD